MRPRISACMIVKNEERFLPMCLKSIKDLVFEIIVVDTGSSDRTVEIAQGYGAKVFTTLGKTASAYIGTSPSHTPLGVGSSSSMLMRNWWPLTFRFEIFPRGRDIDAIMVQIVSSLRNGKSEAVHTVERIFKNNGKIHYEGRVHNRLVGIEKAKVFPIRLIHYGYDGRSRAKKKFERTVSLLKLDLEENPGNPLTHHYLSCSYLSRAMFGEAFGESCQAIRLAEGKGDKSLVFLWSHYNAAIASYRLSNLEGAERFALKRCRDIRGI